MMMGQMESEPSHTRQGAGADISCDYPSSSSRHGFARPVAVGRGNRTGYLILPDVDGKDDERRGM